MNKSIVLCITILLIFSMSFSIFAQENTILRANFSWPTQIDPAVGSDESSSTAITNLYDTLVYPTSDGKIIPYLAKSWEISDDSLTYTFNLNKGVKFHDGSELTAEDVKFSFDRLQAIGQGYAYIFKGRVKEVSVVDDYTVEFKLAETFGPFLSTLVRLYIVNKDQVMANIEDGQYGEYGDYGKEWLNINDAGTGAYKVKEFNVGTDLLLEKFDDYFGEIREHAPDQFKMIGTTDAVTVKTLMKNRELEISDQWQTKESFDSLVKIEGVQMARFPDGGELYLMLNTKKAPTDDIHVRRAIAYAFDYNVVIENIYPGTTQACGPISGALPGWKEVYQYNKDLEKAREELQKSKYYGELDKYPITLGTNADVPDLEKISLMLMSDGRKIGLNMNIEKMPWMKIIDRVARIDSTPHILSIWVKPHYAEAGSVLKSKYHSSNTGTWEQAEWLQNEEVDALIDKALSTIDKEERFKLYGEVQKKVVDLCPSVFCYDNVVKHVYQAHYIDWPRAENSIPVLGYNFDMRFIEVYPELREELK